MTISKDAFGQFISSRRRAIGLTQKELAQRLYVTESAVSKWERGLSYPPISLVAALARELQVSEASLINASEDHTEQQVEREARFYRRWRHAILWTTATAYLIALLATLIVNLAVDGSLTWFWVVLTAIAVASTLTTLPLLRIAHRGWTVLGSFLTALTALLVTIWLQEGRGDWLPITLTAITFATVVLFGPLLLQRVELPLRVRRHLAPIALALDTALLVALIVIATVLTGQGSIVLTQALPITVLSIAYPWVTLLAWQYIRAPRTVRLAAVLAFIGVYSFAVFMPLIARITDSPRHRIDLTRWDQDAYLNGNISLLVLVGLLAIALVLIATAAVHQRRG